MFPLIFWEIEYVGEEKNLYLDKKGSELSQLKKLRHHLDNDMKHRVHHLGDVTFEEHYEKGHFHHMGQNLKQGYINGCDYCHSPFPHKNDQEARAFRNMHGFFLTCETCHFPKSTKLTDMRHSWIDLKSGKESNPPMALLGANDQNSLKKSRGNYNSRIGLWLQHGSDLESIQKRSSVEEARWVLKNLESIPEAQLKKTINSMHSNLTKEPLKCNACHTQKGAAVNYLGLGYPKELADKLRDSQAASVIKKYDKFHFPNLFIRKDDRIRERARDQQKNGF